MGKKNERKSFDFKVAFGDEIFVSEAPGRKFLQIIIRERSTDKSLGVFIPFEQSVDVVASMISMLPKEQRSRIVSLFAETGE